MAISRAQINWSGVTFASAPLTRIVSGGFDQGGELIRFKGDTDRFTSIIACVNVEPSAQFASADVGTFMGLAPGTAGLLVAQLNDALSVTAGAVAFSLVNATFETAVTQAQHAQFAGVTGSWQGYASDGVTNPLTFTRV